MSAAPTSSIAAVATVIGYAIRESVRRKVLTVVVVLTV